MKSTAINRWTKTNCLQKEADAKKLFATTTPKKIVGVDEMSIPPPPLQKNNGPSLIGRINSFKTF
jgi:hypothetical protein